jgi:ABC-type uncharacterized transport system ATPase subunit
MNDYAVEFHNITKTFGSLTANGDITWCVKKGEVHALLGENGAGKSTLTSILFGLIHADSGTIKVNGHQVVIKSPNDASALGIGMVHQHFKLVPSYTVAQNIVLGNEPKTKWGHIDLKKACKRISQLSEQFGLAVDPLARIRDINVSQQQRVEILKMLYRNAEILVLDEPTAVLTPQEIEDLLRIIANLKAQGRTIIFISHKLREIKACADRVSVLRRGLMLGTHEVTQCSENDLATLMVGRTVSFGTPRQPRQPGPEVLTVNKLCVNGALGALAVNNCNFSVRSGEILGIAGVDGNGQSELALALTGVVQPVSGSIAIDGVDITHWSVRKRIEWGMGMSAENRETQASVGPFTLIENYSLKTYYREPLAHRGFLNHTAMREICESQMKSYDVRSSAGPETLIQELSGGNRQKLIIAREVALASHLLIVCQPTRGLDVGSIEYIHQRIVHQRDEGKAVLLMSFELDEILNLCDRIAIISHGQIVDIVEGAQADRSAIGKMMAGVKE